MKTIKAIIILGMATIFVTTTYAAEVPRESAPCNATEECMQMAEALVGSVLDEVQNGLGYSDANAKASVILFNAWMNGQTNGLSYGSLADVTNNAIWQYRDMYLRPWFYENNKERVRAIIQPVIDDYTSNKVDYQTASKNARILIYKSINPSFNPEVEFAKDTCYRDIPSVDSSLFIIARKLILESK